MALKIEEDFIKVNNFTLGRHGQKIKAIVIHVMEGTYEGTDNWFDKESSDVSAHYGVAKDGRIKQWVHDEDQAWHAGIVKDPTATIVKQMGAINPNAYTIGIEHEGFAKDNPPEVQMEASAELISMLCYRWNLSPVSGVIIPHHAIRADKTCPGNISVSSLITRVVNRRRNDVEMAKAGLAAMVGDAAIKQDIQSIRAILSRIESRFL